MIGNFRDLGGVKNKNGKIVKKGLFFRSSNLGSLSNEDIQAIKDLNIKCIFDYRTDEEANHEPTIVIPGIRYIRVPAFSMGSFLQGNQSISFNKEEMQNQIFELVSTNKMYDMMLKLYESLPINNSSYKKLVELIQDSNELAFLSHCTSGKDRTGVGSAIIYMILGVDRDTIMKDYLESNVYAKTQIEGLIKQYPQLENIPYDYINNMLGVNENYILAVFKAIDSKYKTVEEYLLHEFDLNEEKIERIRAYCLE